MNYSTGIASVEILYACAFSYLLLQLLLQLCDYILLLLH